MSALRKLGIDYVVTDRFAKSLADEAARKAIGAAADNTAVITESPAVKNFIAEFYPELERQVCVLDSPQKLFGDYVKKTFAEEKGIDPATIKTINVTTSNEACAEAVDNGCVDFSLNARELIEKCKAGEAPAQILWLRA